MANVKISALPAATSVASADVLPIVQSATTKKATFQVLSDALGVTSTVAGSSPGLVYVAGTTFSSAQASVAIDACFTATFTNYRIIIDHQADTNTQNTVMQLRASGSNLTSGYYYAGNYATYTGGSGVISGSSVGQWVLGGSGTAMNETTIDISRPQTASNTSIVFQNVAYGSSFINAYSGGGINTSVSSYDGFRIYPSSGTFTGSIRVYGYRQA